MGNTRTWFDNPLYFKILAFEEHAKQNNLEILYFLIGRDQYKYILEDTVNYTKIDTKPTIRTITSNYYVLIGMGGEKYIFIESNFLSDNCLEAIYKVSI